MYLATLITLYYFWTGSTPQRREITYPRILTKTDDHGVILTDYRSTYQQDPIVMNLESQLATVDEENSAPRIVIEQVGTSYYTNIVIEQVSQYTKYSYMTARLS